MPLIPTRIHAVADYATSALMLAAPALPLVRDRRAAALLRAAGGGTLVMSALTDYELGLRRRLPVRTHLALDAATGAVIASAPWTLLRGRRTALGRLPYVLFGAGEIALAALTRREPADAGEQPPVATPGVTGQGVAAASARGELGPRLATPPLETPGPSVTPPALPDSDVERAEWADSRVPDPEALATSGPDETLVAQEEAAAAAEASSIGGPAPDDADDPAMNPVYQAGGGPQEGWEAAEADLVENATHADGHGDPLRDAIAPEAEADRSPAVYGEPDQLPSTEVVEDPSTGPDDAGEGVHLSPDRGSGMDPQPDRAHRDRAPRDR